MSGTNAQYNTFLEKGIDNRNKELEETRAERWFNKLSKETQENIMNMNNTRNETQYNTGGKKSRRKIIKFRHRVKKHKTTVRRRKIIK